VAFFKELIDEAARENRGSPERAVERNRGLSERLSHSSRGEECKLIITVRDPYDLKMLNRLLRGFLRREGPITITLYRKLTLEQRGALKRNYGEMIRILYGDLLKRSS